MTPFNGFWYIHGSFMVFYQEWYPFAAVILESLSEKCSDCVNFLTAADFNDFSTPISCPTKLAPCYF